VNLVKNNIFRCIKEPVCFTFLASIALSLIAIFGVVTIGKDGALYVDVARSITSEGFAVAFDKFNWPWYSILIALVHSCTKIDHEIIAYMLAVIFMAGTCSLLVSMVKNKTPAAVYWAVLLVLSVPVFNEFRGSVIRESGFWFFIVLAIWIVSLRSEITFLQGFAIQLAIVCAALFRLEALFVAPAILVYFLFDGNTLFFKEKVLNIFKTFIIFIILFLFGAIAVFWMDLLTQPRVAKYLHLINPYAVYESFSLISDKFAQVALRKWSHSDAGVIVFFGFLAALIIRIISYAGMFSFILLDSVGRKKLIEGAKTYKLNLFAAAFYICVLFIFFFQSKFINSRYISMFLLLSIPIMSVAIHGVKDKWPKLINIFVIVSVLFMFANVITTSTKKTHYLEAAQWVKDNTEFSDKIYYDDSRVAYYAGRGYPDLPAVEEVLESKSHKENYEYFVIESDVDDKFFLDWIEKNNFKILSEKTNGKKTLYIFSR